MGLIGKIRDNTGVAVGIIAVALGAFIVGGEFLTTCTRTADFDNNVVVVNGEKISVDVYKNYYNAAKIDASVDNGGQPLGQNDEGRVKYSAWEKMLFDYVYKPQFEELGLTVTPEEFVAMTRGDYTSPLIAALFGGQQFDKQQFVQFLDNFDQVPVENQQIWLNYKERIIPERLKAKLTSLITQSLYINNLEARLEGKNQNTKANFNFLFVPFYSIPDSSIEVTDEALTDYLKRNEAKYRQKKNGVSFKYITIPINPSAADSSKVFSEINDIKLELGEAKNDSVFANRQSDATTPSTSDLEYNFLPAPLKADSLNLKEGNLYGPYLEGDRYKVYKVSKIWSDTAFEKSAASHILFNTQGVDSIALVKKAIAVSVLNRALNGENFAQLAQQFSEDPGSKDKGGELGEVDSSTPFVEPFKSVIVNSTSTGVVDSLIETSFGYHIINVTKVKKATGTKLKYKISAIERNIYALDLTRDSVLKYTNQVLSQVSDTATYSALMKSDSVLNTYNQEAKKISVDRKYVPGINKPETLIQWALDKKRTVGDLSEVFEIENKYIIAVITNKIEKGTPKLEDVKDEIKSYVKNELKAKVILNKLNGLEGSLMERKNQYGDAALYQNVPQLLFSANAIASVGTDPGAVGHLFALENGEISAAYSGVNGISLYEMVKLETPAQDLQFDLNVNKNTLGAKRSSKENANIFNALKEVAEIEDLRYKYPTY